MLKLALVFLLWLLFFPDFFKTLIVIYSQKYTFLKIFRLKRWCNDGSAVFSNLSFFPHLLSKRHACLFSICWLLVTNWNWMILICIYKFCALKCFSHSQRCFELVNRMLLLYVVTHIDEVFSFFTNFFGVTVFPARVVYPQYNLVKLFNGTSSQVNLNFFCERIHCLAPFMQNNMYTKKCFDELLHNFGFY